jgi:hypothetical protein
LAIELLPQNALAAAPVTVDGIILVALVSAFLPVPMAFDVAIPLFPRRAASLCRDNSLHAGNH